MTTQVVSLKVFRLKAKVIIKAIVPHVVEETVGSRSNHGFTLSHVPGFSNSLQPTAYLPE